MRFALYFVTGIFIGFASHLWLKPRPDLVNQPLIIGLLILFAVATFALAMKVSPRK